MNRHFRLALVGAVIAGLFLFLLAVFAVAEALNDGEIAPNVTAAGVHIGGLSPEDATELLRLHERQLRETPAPFRGPGLRRGARPEGGRALPRRRCRGRPGGDGSAFRAVSSTASPTGCGRSPRPWRSPPRSPGTTRRSRGCSPRGRRPPSVSRQGRAACRWSTVPCSRCTRWRGLGSTAPRRGGWSPRRWSSPTAPGWRSRPTPSSRGSPTPTSIAAVVEAERMIEDPVTLTADDPELCRRVRRGTLAATHSAPSVPDEEPATDRARVRPGDHRRVPRAAGATRSSSRPVTPGSSSSRTGR